jgi:hypothetical protein
VIHRPITTSVRSPRPVVMARDYDAANESDTRWMLTDEGHRREPDEWDGMELSVLLGVALCAALVVLAGWIA